MTRTHRKNALVPKARIGTLSWTFRMLPSDRCLTDEPDRMSGPIHIGRHSMVGTRVVLLQGVKVPERAMVGAGTVFRGAPEGTGWLWSGVPATRVRDIDETGTYFTQTTGHVA